MRVLASIGVLLFFAVPVCAQQQTGASAGVPMPPAGPAPVEGAAGVAAPASRVFHVHVADGRTGDAIAGARLQIWYDDVTGRGFVTRTDGNGDAAMPQPVGAPVRVLVSVSGFMDCRKAPAGSAPEGYNLQTIAAGGLAAENGCGHAGTRTGPGELVLFARPSRWYDTLNKSPL